ncbi:hypothetical protein HanIR_Chr01g0023031 [Helianthus annuus]|nr:hypothetical protein HanIR_Chr01g0023031 [Helianthus annuus]
MYKGTQICCHTRSSQNNDFQIHVWWDPRPSLMRLTTMDTSYQDPYVVSIFNNQMSFYPGSMRNFWKKRLLQIRYTIFLLL